jgi:hypothetical protein
MQVLCYADLHDNHLIFRYDMGKFLPGNQVAAKGRRVEKMIERALLQEDDRRLREGIEKLLDEVAKGERWALEFVRDSLDGKPRQAVDVGTDDPARALVVRIAYGQQQGPEIAKAVGLDAAGGQSRTSDVLEG